MTVPNGVTRPHRVFYAAVVWTLGLLLLGSIVHATESSLACPDWPTCFGTMMPEMTGGVFWEHLHRMVAGGLVILWAAGTWLLFRERPRDRFLRHAAVWGVVLLLVQSVFGGLTVLMRLPDGVSTTHLGLAFLFLALAVVMTVDTRKGRGAPPTDPASRRLRTWALVGAGLVYLQSLVGALVRHTDSGLACPDIPLCIGEVVPPLDQWPIALHFGHRLLGMVAVGVVVYAAVLAYRLGRRAGLMALAGVLVVLQAVIGFVSVGTFLTPWAVSLHTLGAAAILATLVGVARLLGAGIRTEPLSEAASDRVPVAGP